ncbi:RNA-guided endonuclease TnpB family protein [Aneurinibacillus sp. REN35]|uniref:RNA-guided endonuclease TnpB family protein n=1 Tax=Aneurinibacillus sp. REN35 TaxID=3237286 RepID=UPI0035278B45
MLCPKAFRFRLFPTSDQAQLLHQTFGCTRYIYNHFLTERKRVYEETGQTLSAKEMSSQLPLLKESLPWLKKADSIALQATIQALDIAYQKFFKEKKGFPRFKRRRNEQSYTTKNVNGSIRVEGNHIKLPKLGWVRFAKSREIEGRILRATLLRMPTGK